MDLIVAAPDGTVSAMDVINAAADLEKKMTMTHAEELITRLVHGMWMSEVCRPSPPLFSLVCLTYVLTLAV